MTDATRQSILVMTSSKIAFAEANSEESEALLVHVTNCNTWAPVTVLHVHESTFHQRKEQESETTHSVTRVLRMPWLR